MKEVIYFFCRYVNMYIETNYLMFSTLGVIIDFFDCMIEYICCGHRGL